MTETYIYYASAPVKKNFKVMAQSQDEATLIGEDRFLRWLDKLSKRELIDYIVTSTHKAQQYCIPSGLKTLNDTPVD